MRRSVSRTMQILQHISRSMPSHPVLAGPWRADFLSHIDNMEAPIFNFSTIHPVDTASASAANTPFVPRSRTVVFRGLWASLPTNPKNTADLNPDAYESDLLTITTDVRMEKIPELLGNTSDAAPQSGGGGPVEATFWAVPDKTQWRLRGRAYIIGPDIDTEAASSVKKIIQAHMRSTGDTSTWSWSRELTAHFGNLSPGMRGSFRNPPPGTPLSEKPSKGLGLGQQVEDLHDEIARKNFRVIVIVPEEVDRVDLTDPAEGKRWNYKLVDGTSWETTELWP